MKRITKYFAMLWIMGMCLYSSVLLGTLAHELMHAQDSHGLKAIEISYNGSGVTKAISFDDASHKWIYFNGAIVQTFLMMISFLSIIIISKQ